MHTFKTDDGYVLLHNGDYSGDVVICSCDDIDPAQEITLPCRVLLEFVAESIRANRISELEQASTEDLLK